MTSTELDLKRTLTDVLEDELYNINYHGQNSRRNVLGLSLPAEFDETMLNGEFWNQQQQPQQQPQQDQQIEWNQSQDENNIFNKYADPSLTTTSSHLKNDNNNVATTPVQGTVNLNSVMKVNNPFLNMRYQLPYDVKITNDYHDEADSIYSPQADEDPIGFDGSNNPKMQWPLQDNNMALSNEDARMIFDHEFAADDDDLSDEDDDEDGNEDENQKVFDACDFVDGTKGFGAQDSSDQAIMDDEDDDLIDEDELYEPSIRNGRKESVVTTPQAAIVEPSPPITTSTSSSAFTPSDSRSSNNNSRSRRKLPITDTNSNNNNLTSTGSHHNSSSSNNGEIYTCLILNNITRQPCSAQFSRSYDLTRHQNTIHAKKKTVFRCSECIRMLGHDGYQKTFSRLDALTRHIKSKHENLSLEQRQEVTKYAKENIGYVV
ncbi:ZYRO0A05302p [Zygosaccharomyces rouxii]|uniref:ZYRO0A05302p n=1 Tax=Zygosaccharomyces rouxii (strain ATCC 2623 / CBS 732 / NBRC 1130 / NCYC 568 / NRRL Y-229) TaxID=559307 RepID=C5DPQ7_ZYGRC|nr:uncharacterized protein ZYRO0A05302g [Zygosaccharomyces rouxii]KAH9198812.1 hypothetical protein LQ764DRAFT_141815 [Zygosaccharomyces rouxii]CAR25668.1 ZYRO0A05302p [Zygosaccharomyces rouxii]